MIESKVNAGRHTHFVRTTLAVSAIVCSSGVWRRSSEGRVELKKRLSYSSHTTRTRLPGSTEHRHKDWHLEYPVARYTMT